MALHSHALSPLSLSSLTLHSIPSPRMSDIYDASPISSAEHVNNITGIALSQLGTASPPALFYPQLPKQHADAIRLPEHLRERSLQAHHERRTNHTGPVDGCRRFFSADDIADFKSIGMTTTHGHSLIHGPAFLSMTSSSEASSQAFHNERSHTRSPLALDLEPSYPPPPERCPTPPGLPSFGSHQAMNLRGMPRIPKRYRSLYQQQAQQRQHQSQDPTAVDETVARSTSPSRPDWFFGLFHGDYHPNSIPATSPYTGTNLPRGIIAIAPDGTPVRGRFGMRVSGHNVGGGPAQGSRGLRGIEAHRFHNGAEEKGMGTGQRGGPSSLHGGNRDGAGPRMEMREQRHMDGPSMSGTAQDPDGRVDDVPHSGSSSCVPRWLSAAWKSCCFCFYVDAQLGD